MLDLIKKLFSTGITVTPERYESLKKAHDGASKIVAISGEALEEMGPNDNTPYVLTGGELIEKTLGKLSDKLGN